MGLDKRFRKAVMGLLLCFLAGGGDKLDAAATYPVSPEGVLRAYCDTNFLGRIGAAYAYARTSYPIRHEGGPISIMEAPVVIVSTYHVLGVQLSTNDSAIGKVVFERLAYTLPLVDSYKRMPAEREMVSDYKEADEIQYQLKKIAGKWYVYNPPTSRVSIAAMDNYYFNQVASFLPNDFWIDPKFSNAQRKNIAKELGDIKVLMQISADYLDRLRERYKNAGGLDHPDSERQKRVKVSYTGKWNIEILPETQPKPVK